MLKIVTGRAGSGKSEYCVARARELAERGSRTVIVVPEQSSFEVERAAALFLGPKLSQFAEVKSFRRLCADIFIECGGGAKKRIDDAVQCSLVRRAVTMLGGEIKCFKRHKRDVAFFSLTASVIRELKNAGVSPGQLAEIARGASSPLSQSKLLEIGRIYDVYETLVSAKFYDGASEISSAAQLCRHSRQFSDTYLLFDGFTGFTEPQFSMIENLMHVSEGMCVTLCCDDIYDVATDAFSTVRQCARKLVSLAKKHGLETQVTQAEQACKDKIKGIQTLEKYLAGQTITEPGNDGVFAIEGGDRYDEIQKVADEIVALVRDKGYRYSDIVVVSRDAETYRAAISTVFSQFGIPYFSDANRNMLYSPVTVFALAAFDIASGITTHAVLDILKTSLCDIDQDAVSELENYLFVWGIDRAAWYSPFENNPGGFEQAWTDEAKNALERIEHTRRDVMGWLYPLTQPELKRDGGDAIKAVYETMKRCGAVNALENLGDDEAREASLGLEMLDQLYTMFAGDDAGVLEIKETLKLLAAATPVGDIPPTLEQVVVGTADRMRTDNPKAAFIIGLNDGIFPLGSFDTPLLTGAERDLFVQHGIELSRSFENSAIMEELYLYRVLTCSNERIYLCWARHDQRGSALIPSTRPQAFIDRYGAHTADTVADKAAFVVNAATAMNRYAGALEKDDCETLAALKSCMTGHSADRVSKASLSPEFSINDPELMRGLVGEKTTLSASRIEAFSQCRFKYFLHYIMGIRPIQKAEISPIHAGNFVHGVMESVLRDLSGGIASADKKVLRDTVEKASVRYVETVLGAAAMNEPRIKYLIERLKAQSYRLALHIQDEQKQSEFRPADYELVIGGGGDIEPLTLYGENGETIEVVGKVDRVDVYKKDGKSYVRVVDYKTGVKDFKLSDVYHGLSVQMLLYLFAIEQNGSQRYGDVVPAAVMYLPADPSIPAEKGDAEMLARKAYRMDGIVIDDREIISAMERDVKGIYIPVELDKNGDPKTDKLASLERMGNIQEHIETTVLDMARSVYGGDISACPAVQDGASACDYCNYTAVCRRDRSTDERVLEKLNNNELFLTNN